MCHAEEKNSSGFAQKSDGTRLGLVVLDGEMDRAGTVVDGDVKVAFAPFAIGSLQLGQVLDVDVNEAEVIVLEAALAFGRLYRYRFRAAVSALRP